MSIPLQISTYHDIELSGLIGIFKKYESIDWSFWLDSGQQSLTKNWAEKRQSYAGRYHIIVHSPDLTFQFKQSKVCFDGPWLTQPPSDKIRKQLDKVQQSLSELTCPFDMLNTIQSFYDSCFDVSNIKAAHIPFLAGAVGAFAYDLNTFTDNISDDHPEQFNLADVSVGFYSSSIIYDAELNQLHMFSDGSNRSNPLEANLSSSEESTFKHRFSLKQTWQANLTALAYEQQMAQIDEYLRAGDCYQVNFGQRFYAEYEGEEFDAYLKLRDANKAPFSAFMRLPNSTI